MSYYDNVKTIAHREEAEKAALLFATKIGDKLSYKPFGWNFQKDASFNAVSSGGLLVDHCLFDHPYYYRRAYGVGSAIVSHVYDDVYDSYQAILWATKYKLTFLIDVAPRWWDERAISILWMRSRDIEDFKC